MNVVQNIQKFWIRVVLYVPYRTQPFHLQKFRVPVWKSFRAHRSYGYGYGSLAELQEVPITGMEVFLRTQKFRVGIRTLHPYPHPHPGIFKRAYPYPGYCATGILNLQKLRVRV